jgi:polyphosphate kinase
MESTTTEDAMPDVTPAGAVSETPVETAHEDAPRRRGGRWFDRDLGWLEFNRRVLAEALDERTPLLERVKFLAIFDANLDEFFMKRIAAVREYPDARRARLMAELRDRLLVMLHQQAECFANRLVPALALAGIRLARWEELTAGQQDEARRFFAVQISPALTPLVIQPMQPFPFFANGSLSLAFVLHDDKTGDAADARVKVPKEIDQWVPLSVDVPPGRRVYVRLHEVIRENAHTLYPGMRLSEPTLFRLTRDADVELDDDGEQSLRELVREQVRQRRYEPAVRLEFAAHANSRFRSLLADRFGLSDEDIYDLPGEVDYTSLFQIAALDVPALHDAPWTPVTPPRLRDEADIFETIAAGDLLVHHPYESFEDSVEQFISAAALDKQTIAIKMTVYRVGDDTPFVRSLIRAAEAGKQVACVIELKARFDEERNLHWASELERAGAHVTVGNARLKTHAKVALVVRREPEGLRCYAHIGTGNYHVKTARVYSDVGLFTCDPALTTDVVRLFHHLTGRSDEPGFDRLLVAPGSMRDRFIELIRREVEHHRAGRPARVIAKMNQLEDEAMMKTLADASSAGVPIELIVRGFCCLRPGVAGFSDNIRVRSIIGRFLEHSRIFHFAAGEHDPLRGEFFIGSADWMHRNLSDRVEVVTPVTAAGARERLWEILDLMLRDRRQAWMMNADGSYQRLESDAVNDNRPRLGSHELLIRIASGHVGEAGE